MQFVEYQHIERFGMPEVEFIEIGKCYIFPKIDGTNSSVWLGDDGKVHAGNRHRELTLDKDNAGFFAKIREHKGIKSLLTDNPKLRLFGEWLVPHSLETYRDECWHRFYVFDVMWHMEDGRAIYMPYEAYQWMMDKYDIDYLPPLAIIDHPTKEQLISYLDKNIYLIKDGQGVGEGIVIKNYDFRNGNGEQIWAKIVRSEFKELHAKKMMNPDRALRGRNTVEQQIVDEYVTSALCEKERAKLEQLCGKGLRSIIPSLLHNVYDCLLREDAHHFIIEFGNPTINFRLLRYLCDWRVKECCKDLFDSRKEIISYVAKPVDQDDCT